MTMKTRNWLWAVSLLLTTPSVTHSQTCVDAPKTITYDTVVVGSGNSFNTFTFPKFDPLMGTLMNVSLRTEITLQYGFELENREPMTIPNYRVRVFRDDEITSSTLNPSLFYSFSRNFGPYSLTAGDGVDGSGTDYRIVPLTYVVNHSIQTYTAFNTADFMGAGDVSFDYSASSYSTVMGSVNYQFNPFAKDTIHFSITYNYCPSWFLKADLTSFTATKARDNNIMLQWITQNETPDRIYEVQQSFDGRNFQAIGKKPAQTNSVGAGSYTYNYNIPPNNDHQQIIFRLKQIEKDGTAKYSPVRTVALDAIEGNDIQLYPNPATTSTRIQFSNQIRSNWRVEMISTSGAIVRRYYFNNTTVGRLEGLETLPRGIYIIKATDTKTQVVYEKRLVKQ